MRLATTFVFVFDAWIPACTGMTCVAIRYPLSAIRC